MVKRPPGQTGIRAGDEPHCQPRTQVPGSVTLRKDALYMCSKR